MCVSWLILFEQFRLPSMLELKIEPLQTRQALPYDTYFVQYYKITDNYKQLDEA